MPCARTDLAAGYYRNGQLAVALEEARKRAADRPELRGCVRSARSDLHGSRTIRRAAEENFQRALKLDPRTPRLNNNYGCFLCNTGRERESIEYFNRAIRDPLYHARRGRIRMPASCLMRIKDYAAAEPYLRRSFELDAGPGGAEVSAGAAVPRDEPGRQGDFLLQRSCEIDRVVGRKLVAGLAGRARQRRSANRKPAWRTNCSSAFRSPPKRPRWRAANSIIER